MQGELFPAAPRAIVQKIISGGQTGADRAALDAAIELGIPHGGWVPRGRWAEDGPLDPRYQVQETPAAVVAVRTEWNVRDADATVIFSHGPLTGGSALTLSLARRYQRPALHIDLAEATETVGVQQLQEWLAAIRPAVLNVAGPRASTDGTIYEAVRQVLARSFGVEATRGD